MGRHGNWALAGQEQKAQCGFFYCLAKPCACQPLLTDKKYLEIVLSTALRMEMLNKPNM